MKSNKFLWIVMLALVATMTTSCVTSKKVRYLRNMPKNGLPITETLEATICPYDELGIQVLSRGGDEELLAPFNVISGYLVDARGDIQFPVLGNLHVEGLTRLQLQDTIGTHLQRNGYLSNPMVTARFKNFKVFFLTSDGGQVINVDNERCTFLEALAMSGGLSLTTRRDRIGVLREVDGKRVIHYLDPRSTAVFDDEFFLLQQNDIIFTEESGIRFFRESFSNWTFILSTVTTLTSFVSLYTLIRSLNKD